MDRKTLQGRKVPGVGLRTPGLYEWRRMGGLWQHFILIFSTVFGKGITKCVGLVTIHEFLFLLTYYL